MEILGGGNALYTAFIYAKYTREMNFENLFCLNFDINASIHTQEVCLPAGCKAQL